MTFRAKKLEWRTVSDTSYLASIDDTSDYDFGYAQIEYVKVPGFDAFRWITRLQCLEGISGTWWFDSPEQAKAEIQRKLDEFVRAIVEIGEKAPEHRPISPTNRHHCTCGWEGDRIATHLNDMRVREEE